jgi:hypothetical protein
VNHVLVAVVVRAVSQDVEKGVFAIDIDTVNRWWKRQYVDNG